MTKPVRIQLRRTKGWRMPPNTVKVCRPSVLGNPFKVVESGRWLDTGKPAFSGRHDWEVNYPMFRTKDEAAKHAVTKYRAQLEDYRMMFPEVVNAQLQSIRGKNLACWCALDAPCHADVLLELANVDQVQT